MGRKGVATGNDLNLYTESVIFPMQRYGLFSLLVRAN